MSTTENEQAELQTSNMTTYRDPALDTIEQVMESLHAVASVEAVYGAPIKQRETVIIPTAEVFVFSGFGGGQGVGGPDNGAAGASNSGGGGGGGGSAHARPVAVIIASPEGVRVEPIFDLTKIALAGVTFAAFAVGMLARMGNAKRSFDKMSRAIEEG
jgi:uncharacterized spore protein YtfJ